MTRRTLIAGAVALAATLWHRSSARSHAPQHQRLYPIYHDGHLAMIGLRRVGPDETLMAADFIKPDGSPIGASDIIRCETCHAMFDWKSAMRRAFGVGEA